ncbi:DUF3788 family protein [Acetobacterium malicum]|uniref:DUF3788 family protein n=1 Tax=Acetobacterium malicum TaxID=52692 RepID=UPI0039BFA5A1
MEWSQSFEQNHEPTMAEMISFVDNPLWIALQNFIETAYHIKPIMNYSRCSAQRGWNLKYRKSSKSLCVLYLFFASTFCRKLQVKNTECCIMENP